MKKEEIARKMLKFSKKEIVSEHRKLVKDLKSGEPKRLKQEVKKQSKELKQYEKS